MPEKIENILTQSPFIAQIFVYGDSLQSTLVAIIFPEKTILEKWAESNGLSGPYDNIIGHEKTFKFLLDEIKSKCKEAGFFGFEIPTKIHLTTTAFTIENELLTPTMKLKRNEAKLFFLNQIRSMYDGAKLQGEE